MILALAAIVCAVGAVDAAVGHDLDLVAVFILAGVLQLALLLRLQTGRPVRHSFVTP